MRNVESDLEGIEPSGLEPPEIIRLVLGNDQKRLQQLLAENKSLVHSTDQEGNNSLFYAAIKNYLVLMKLLLAARINVNFSSRYGFTALHWAARADQPNAVKLLIESKANVNYTPCELPNVGETQRITPLFVAASRPQEKGGPAINVIQPLLEAKVDPNTRPIHDLGPIHFLIPFVNKYAQTVVLMLQAGAKVRLELTVEEPLLLAAQAKYVKVSMSMCLFQRATLISHYTSLLFPIAQEVVNYVGIDQADIENYQELPSLFRA